MKSSWENELIRLEKTDGSSFDILAKDIQKKTGRLSFQKGETSELYFDIDSPYRHHHYASNAVYVFDSFVHELYDVPSVHACIERYNEDAVHVLEHNGYQRISKDENCLYYEHRLQSTCLDDAYHPAGKKVLYLAGGCFWGMEKVFQQLDGVSDTTVGYANGHTADPTYEEVCRNETGYKETVRVTYDPAVTLTKTILKAYFLCIDPTVKDQQGNDIGSQYQTGIYYRDESLAAELQQIYEAEKEKHTVFYVELEPLSSFYEAEEYHQKYLDKNPLGYCHITPVELAEVRALNKVQKQ